ncbi:hypothetical protein HPB47_003572 [Ixodes persulcatus]|uniref:Uncharacterized protein n=1 Tax=Ixodes persulcatus TaxID=34615 RepID=A0AC60PJ47_IXOPE|nr:hypothetical protein HPB47_003572 [Ixodes persulcatus]
MSKEDAERVQQTEALQDLMGKKMAIWKEILSASRDMDRKEGLKQYRTMAAEELRIIARNVSKTKLRELTDQKINYFGQIGISDSDDNKIANMQGFRQVGDEERLLCALEAPEVAPRVFPDVALDEASLVKLGTLPPGAFGGQAGPVRKQESFTSLVGDTAVLERLEDQVSILEKAALQSRNGERATPYGGVIRQGVHPPPLPLSPAQLMQQAQMMSARLPKRRLPPIGQSPQVEHKSRLVSEFVEKLAEEIAANRISKSEARKQLRDIVEMENELTETLVSATTVRPDVTEDKLQAIAEMYKEISFTIISNPEMNREEAMNKLKRVAAMEHELTQALVPDEVFPYQQKSAEDSMIKLQQMKLNLTDELQRNMAVSQPDADRVQESIKKLYELELKLMDKLFTAKSEGNRRHERGPRRDRDEDDGKRLYLKSKKRPTTTIELSLGTSSDHEDDNIVPMIRIKPPQNGRDGLEKAGKSCPVHGNRTMPCPLHPKDKKKDPSCPVHSERLRTTLSWTVSPGDGGDASESTVPPDRTTRERSGVNHQMESKHPEREEYNQRTISLPPPPSHPYPGRPPHPYPPPHPGHMVLPAPSPWTPPMYPQYPPWDTSRRPVVAYPKQHRQPQELGIREPPVEQEPADGAERYIVPTRYKGMQQEQVRNEDEYSYFGATGNYNKQSWDTTGQEVPQHYMPQDFPLMYPVVPTRDTVFYNSAQVMGYRRMPNVDVAVDAAQPIFEDDEGGKESGPIVFEAGIEINVSPSGTQAPVTQPTQLVVQRAHSSASTLLPAQLPSRLEPPSPRPARRQRPQRRPSLSRQYRGRSRERNFVMYSEDDELDNDSEDFTFRRPRRSGSLKRGTRRDERSWRSGFGDDSERPPPPRWRKRRSRSSQRSRRSYNESAAEEVPPGLPFWDWICKSICNLLPFARDGSGNKSRRGVSIQELVNEVMATSEEVVQAKRQLQSSDGNPEASVRSMGDLEGKLWKLIDLEVDLVNELARYRWSGDVQDPRAEVKLNNAEEKIWKVIGVQKRLAQDLGEWRKNSTRTFQTRAPDPVDVAQPLSYGYEANYNPVNYDNLVVNGNPANFNPNNPDNMGGYVSSGNQGGSRNPAVPDGRDNPNLGTSREAEESTQPPMPPPKVKSTTPVKRTKNRKSSKKRSQSRDLSRDTTTSNSTTNTSVQSSGGSTSEYSTESSDITSTVATEPDSITIATTIVISSEMDDAEGNQRPSAVSWKSPSKEFLSSIDRSQVTPVEWETKRKGKYIYVRPRQGGTGRKPVRSASHSPPKARKPRAHPNARRHSAGPKDSFELYDTNCSRHGRDHRGHAVDRRDSSYYKTDRRPSPHRHPQRPKSHIYAGPPEYSRSFDRHRHSARRHRLHTYCDPYVQRHRRVRKDVDDGETVLSATISLLDSDGTMENVYGHRMPRENNSVAYHHEGRRRYRSMGPHSSRSERRSRSQWSV